MRAVLFTGPGKFEVVELDDPTPGPQDVVVSVVASGICGTDLHILSGELGHSFPFVPGHEFSGEVVEVGKAVTSLRVGDQVAVDPGIPCNECAACRMAAVNQCSNRQGFGETRNGGAAEYVVTPASNAIKIPLNLSPLDAALVEPVACAVHGLDALAGVMGSHVLVYGAGTMGLILTQLLAQSGAASVATVDRDPDRAREALRFGAQSVGASTRELGRAQGWDIVVEATGNADVVAAALGDLATCGRLLLFGMASPQARSVFAPFDVFDREIRIIGTKSYLYSFERSIDILAAGTLDLDRLVSHRLPLEDYGRAIALLRDGAGRKIQLAPSGQGLR